MQRYLALLAFIASFLCFGFAPTAQAKELGHNGRTLVLVKAWMNEHPGFDERHVQKGTTFFIEGHAFVLDGKPLHTLWGACALADKEYRTAQAPEIPAPPAAADQQKISPPAANANDNGDADDISFAPTDFDTTMPVIDWNKTAMLLATILVAYSIALLLSNLSTTITWAFARLDDARYALKQRTTRVARIKPPKKQGSMILSRHGMVMLEASPAANESEPFDTPVDDHFEEAEEPPHERTAAEVAAIIESAHRMQLVVSPYSDDEPDLTAAKIAVK